MSNMPPFEVNPLLHLPPERYLAALQRFRQAIAEGMKLRSWDSDAIGDKDTQCSWGLCWEGREMWPDAQDHTWPVLFHTHGRSAPVHSGGTTEGDECPFDRALDPKPAISGGCFWRCKFFRPKKGETKIDRAEALRLYDAALARAEGQPVSR